MSPKRNKGQKKNAKIKILGEMEIFGEEEIV